MLYCTQLHMGARCRRVAGITSLLYRQVLVDKETAILFLWRVCYEMGHVGIGRRAGGRLGLHDEIFRGVYAFARAERYGKGSPEPSHFPQRLHPLQVCFMPQVWQRSPNQGLYSSASGMGLPQVSVSLKTIGLP